MCGLVVATLLAELLGLPHRPPLAELVGLFKTSGSSISNKGAFGHVKLGLVSTR